MAVMHEKHVLARGYLLPVCLCGVVVSLESVGAWCTFSIMGNVLAASVCLWSS
jgi:hypothetical protein